MIRAYLAKLVEQNRGFKRNVLTLMSGTILAQIISLASAPVITRIYSPKDYGVLAIYLAVATIVGGLVSARYEMAIVIPKLRSQVDDLVRLCSVLSYSGCLLVLVLIVPFNGPLASLLKVEHQRGILYLVPVGILYFALTAVYTNWNIKYERFSNISTSRVVQSGCGTLFQIGFGALTSLGSYGLVLGQLLAQICGNLTLSRKFWDQTSGLKRGVRLKRLAGLASRYRDFPRFMLMAGLLNKATSYLPVLLLGWAYSPTIVGYYAISQRVIQTPMSVIGGSVSEAYLKKSSDLALQDLALFRRKTIQMSSYLLAIGLVPAGTLLLFSEDIFTFVFGSQWAMAGRFCQIMSGYLLFQFAFSPLCRIFAVLETQRLYSLWEWLRFLFCLGGMYLGIVWFDAERTMLFFTMAMVLSYLVLIFFVHVSFKRRMNGKSYCQSAPIADV